MALYYLGLYFTIMSEPDKAIAYWKKIKEAPQEIKSIKRQSPWAQLAKMKLVELGQERE